MFSNIGSKATTTSVNLNLSNWNTSNVTDMSYMFAFVGEKAGKVIISGLENWNTSKVENMTYMFCRAARYNCISFSLNLSNWDTSNVTLMNQMFSSVGQYITTLSLQGLAN